MAGNRRPKAPNGLNDEAQNLWSEAVTRYEFAEHELALLRSACKALTSLRKVQSQIEKEGATVYDRFQQAKEHPSIRSLQILDQQFRNNLDDLGLDAADAQLEKAQEPLSKFNKNGGVRRIR
jgi:phage terminase small subunit